MEVSSHALELHRADAIHWAVAVVHEPHAGPPRLPSGHGGLLRGQAPAVRRRPPARRAGRQRRRSRTARAAGRGALERASRRDRRATPTCAPATCSFDRSGSSFTRRRAASCASPLPGRFNVLNVLGAVAVARALGVDDDDDRRARCRRPARVPGRFEPVDEGQPFAVLVDYAHTPDSLDNVLRAARELDATARVIVRVRRRRRPRPRQAPADGRDRRRLRRRRDRHLRQPALGGPARRSSPRSSPGSSAPDAPRSELDRRAAIERAVGARADAATSS